MSAHTQSADPENHVKTQMSQSQPLQASGEPVQAPAQEVQEHSHTSAQTAASDSNQETLQERAATPTYEEIVEMILTNKTPAGIKEIPDKVLGADSASQSRASPRPKPWESRQGTPS